MADGTGRAEAEAWKIGAASEKEGGKGRREGRGSAGERKEGKAGTGGSALVATTGVSRGNRGAEFDAETAEEEGEEEREEEGGEEREEEREEGREEEGEAAREVGDPKEAQVPTPACNTGGDMELDAEAVEEEEEEDGQARTEGGGGITAAMG